MRRQPLILLGLALAAGGLAAFLALQMLRPSAPADDEGERPTTVTVAVAERDLGVGTLIEPEDVRLVDWPAEAVPAGFSSSASDVVGRGLLTSVAENEPLLQRKLAGPESGGGLHITIPEGKRAMSVRVDDVVGVAGFVLPGTRVDVVVTMDRDTQAGEPETEIVLQNLTVLSAGQSIETNPQGEPVEVPVVTLAVDPEEAEKLAMAHSNGRIQLALRNPLDLELEDTPGIRASHLIGGVPAAPVARAAPAPQPQQPQRRQLEVYRGDQRSTSDVDSSSDGDGGGDQ